MKFSDTILVLGVSGCIFLPIVKVFKRKVRVIVNIDGMEWKRSKWGGIAKWFLKLSEKFAVKNSDVVVSDNKVIQEYIQEQYSVDSRLISYGADHVKKLLITDELLEEYRFLSVPYAFSVCRIEPENNIDIILSAIQENRRLNLVIVGNWSNSDYGKKLKKNFSHVENLFLLDPIYDQKVLDQLRSNCLIYLHGHSAGGTNPSLVEAMYLALPILAFDVNFNRVTTGERALYFDDTNSLSKHLSLLDKYDLDKIAHDLKSVADKYYLWRFVASRYEDIL